MVYYFIKYKFIYLNYIYKVLNNIHFENYKEYVCAWINNNSICYSYIKIYTMTKEVEDEHYF